MNILGSVAEIQEGYAERAKLNGFMYWAGYKFGWLVRSGSAVAPQETDRNRWQKATRLGYWRGLGGVSPHSF